MNLNSPISVLHINTSKAWGGLEIYTLELIKRMNQQDQNVALYCLPGTKLQQEATNAGIKIFYGFKNGKLSFKDIKKIRKIIKNERIKLIHSHTRNDIWLAYFAKVFQKKLKHIYSLYMSAHPKKDFLHKLIYKKIDAIISSSLLLNNEIKLNFPIPESNIHLIRYGREKIPAQKTKETVDHLRHEWKTESDDIVIGSMSRIDPKKGIQEIVESFLYLPDHVKCKVKIWIIGEPTIQSIDKEGLPIYENKSYNLYNWMTSFIQENKLENNIILIPFQKNYFPFLQAMDIFILATYKETYSLSVLDAMSAGLPIIGTDTGGTAEQVKNLERGILIKPKCPKEIAKSIVYYFENRNQISIHGNNAKKWVDNEHRWENKLNKLNSLYFSILEN